MEEFCAFLECCVRCMECIQLCIICCESCNNCCNKNDNGSIICSLSFLKLFCKKNTFTEVLITSDVYTISDESGLPRDQFLSNHNSFYNSGTGAAPFMPTAPPFLSANPDVITTQPYRSDSEIMFGVGTLSSPPNYESLYGEQSENTFKDLGNVKG